MPSTLPNMATDAYIQEQITDTKEIVKEGASRVEKNAMGPVFQAQETVPNEAGSDDFAEPT